MKVVNSPPQAWVVSKGSPEAMVKLLDGTTMPEWYDREYDRLARAGRRVIALAHRSLGATSLAKCKAYFKLKLKLYELMLKLEL